MARAIGRDGEIGLQDGSNLGYTDEAFEGVRTPWKLRLLRDSVNRLVPTAIGTVVPFVASHSDGSGYLAAALTANEGVRQKDLVAYVQTWFRPERAVWAAVVPGDPGVPLSPGSHRAVLVPASGAVVTDEQLLEGADAADRRVHTATLQSGASLVSVTDPALPYSVGAAFFQGGSASGPVGLFDVAKSQEVWTSLNTGAELPFQLPRAGVVLQGETGGTTYRALQWSALAGQEGLGLWAWKQRLVGSRFEDKGADPAEVLANQLGNTLVEPGVVAQRLAAQRAFGSDVWPRYREWRKAMLLPARQRLTLLRGLRQAPGATLVIVGPALVEGLHKAAVAGFDPWPVPAAEPPPLAPLRTPARDAGAGGDVLILPRARAHLAAVCAVPEARATDRVATLALQARFRETSPQKAGRASLLGVTYAGTGPTGDYLRFAAELDPDAAGALLVEVRAGLAAAAAETLTNATVRRLALRAATEDRLDQATSAGLVDALRYRALESDREHWFLRRAQAYVDLTPAALQDALAECAATLSWAVVGPEPTVASLTASGLQVAPIPLERWMRDQLGDDAYDASLKRK